LISGAQEIDFEGMIHAGMDKILSAMGRIFEENWTKIL